MTSPKYEYWYTMYMINGVSLQTLNKLAEAEKLTKEEVNIMVKDRLEQKNF